MLLWTGHFPPGLQTLLRVCENERCREQLYIHYSAKSKYVCAWWDLLGVSAGQPVHPVLPFCVILQVLVCNICKGTYTFLANTTINSRWRHCFWVLFGVVGRNQISSMTFSWVVENIRSQVVRIYFTEDSYKSNPLYLQIIKLIQAAVLCCRAAAVKDKTFATHGHEAEFLHFSCWCLTSTFVLALVLLHPEQCRKSIHVLSKPWKWESSICPYLQTLITALVEWVRKTELQLNRFHLIFLVLKILQCMYQTQVLMAVMCSPVWSDVVDCSTIASNSNSMYIFSRYIPQLDCGY